MKTLGIIGGIAPGSTMDYYRSIIELYRRRKQDGSYPPILINSIDMRKMLDLIAADELAAVTVYLAGEVDKLVKAGADFGLLASNTPHIVFDKIQSLSAIPLISIVEAACAAATELGIRKAGLFGTRFTMQGHFYAEAFARQGIEIIAPDLKDQHYIHDKYMNELVEGRVLDETRQGLLAVVDRLKSQKGIQGLILGGTELPLILKEATYKGVRFLDTTRIHVERAVEEMLS
jgi:aspartate racemase